MVVSLWEWLFCLYPDYHLVVRISDEEMKYMGLFVADYIKVATNSFTFLPQR